MTGKETKETWKAIKKYIADKNRKDPNRPNFLKPRCLSCECDEIEHKVYWDCPHLKGDICDICCKFDSLDPEWNWQECNGCSHEKDRHVTLDMNANFVIFQEDGKIYRAINIPRSMKIEDIPDPEELCDATDDNIEKYKTV